MAETEKALDRLSELAQRVIQLAMRMKPGGVRVPRLGDDPVGRGGALPAVPPGDNLA